MRILFLIMMCSGCASYQSGQTTILSTNDTINITAAEDALWASVRGIGNKPNIVRRQWLESACVAQQFIIEYETKRTPDSALNVEAAVATAQAIERTANPKRSLKRLKSKPWQ